MMTFMEGIKKPMLKTFSLGVGPKSLNIFMAFLMHEILYKYV